eukprot:389265_1
MAQALRDTYNLRQCYQNDYAMHCVATAIGVSVAKAASIDAKSMTTAVNTRLKSGYCPGSLMDWRFFDYRFQLPPTAQWNQWRFCKLSLKSVTLNDIKSAWDNDPKLFFRRAFITNYSAPNTKHAVAIDDFTPSWEQENGLPVYVRAWDSQNQIMLTLSHECCLCFVEVEFMFSSTSIAADKFDLFANSEVLKYTAMPGCRWVPKFLFNIIQCYRPRRDAFKALVSASPDQIEVLDDCCKPHDSFWNWFDAENEIICMLMMHASRYFTYTVDQLIIKKTKSAVRVEKMKYAVTRGKIPFLFDHSSVESFCVCVVGLLFPFQSGTRVFSLPNQTRCGKLKATGILPYMDAVFVKCIPFRANKDAVFVWKALKEYKQYISDAAPAPVPPKTESKENGDNDKAADTPSTSANVRACLCGDLKGNDVLIANNDEVVDLKRDLKVVINPVGSLNNDGNESENGCRIAIGIVLFLALIYALIMILELLNRTDRM